MRLLHLAARHNRAHKREQEKFDQMRMASDCKRFRFSPSVPGLSLFKRIILAGYVSRLFSLTLTQRLVDLSRCWEA